MSEAKANIGIVTVSDRASRGAYEDLGGPAMIEWLDQALVTPWQPHYALIEDDQATIEATLSELAEQCDLILTTGGTGPAMRDVTPEATQAVCQKMLPGFGELMRQHSLQYVPTAILSRQTAGICGQSLIINLPGKPKAIGECLEAVFPAVPYCLDLINAAYLECVEGIKVFRPKS